MNALVLLVCVPSQSFEDDARIAMTFAIAHRARNAARVPVVKKCECSASCECGCQQGEPCECDNQKALRHVQSVPTSQPVQYRFVTPSPVSVQTQNVSTFSNVPTRKLVTQPVKQPTFQPTTFRQPVRQLPTQPIRNVPQQRSYTPIRRAASSC